jgi:hypothetical protein
MNLNIVLWVVLLLALYAAVAAAALANRPGRHWLALPAVALVAVAIVLAVFDAGRSAPGLGFLVAAGVGLLLLALVAGSPLVSLVLEFASRGAVPVGNHGVLAVDVKGIVPVEREILRGGMTIGYLERLAVVGSAFAGQPAAVAVIVAIKGLGRFAELENSAARERFIIGTMVSLIWAGACAAPLVLSL